MPSRERSPTSASGKLERERRCRYRNSSAEIIFEHFFSVSVRWCAQAISRGCKRIITNFFFSLQTRPCRVCSEREFAEFATRGKKGELSEFSVEKSH